MNAAADSQLAILMATCNGAPFLREQIDSLLRQTQRSFTLYVHDDGSSDGTAALLDAYAAQHPCIIPLRYPPAGGACANFLSLLERVEADYYMFCDQDDVWEAEKVERMMAVMQAAEHAQPGRAVIVHCDLQVVAADLSPLQPSLWQMAHIDADYLTTFHRVGPQSVVTGCAMLFNRQARQCVRPAVPATYMHDAWVTLCVLRDGGLLLPLHEALVKYRQHGDNQVGAVAASRYSLSWRLAHLSTYLARSRRTYAQARAAGYSSLTRYLWNKISYIIWKKRRKDTST